MDAAKVVTELERIEYVEDPHLGKGSYCVVERHADGGACSVPDYAVIKIFRHIVQGEGPDTIVREIDEAIQALPEGYDTVCTDGMFSQGEWQLLSIARAAAADILPYCCWMRSPPIWMPRRRPVCGRPCVRPPVGAPSSPFPTASMRVLAAGLWRSGPKDSKCRECSPGSRKTSGAAKCWGKKRLTASMGSVMMNRGRRDLFQPSTEVNVHG